MSSHPIPYGSHHPLHIHLSSLPSLPALTVPVPTTETTTSSLLQQDTSPLGIHHPSHAHYASSDPSSGLLLRVVSNKLALDITSIALSSSSPSTISLPRPVRFVFPSPLLPTPAVFSSPVTRSVTVLAMTESGHLFTLVLPLDGKKWEGLLGSDEGWSWEHAVVGSESRTPTTFHAVDDQTVLVGTADGVIIRLEQDQDSWRETDLKPSSYLSSFASLFSSNRALTASPSSHSSSLSSSKHSSSPSEIVSLSSYLQEDTLGLAFSLSRDRKLRVWNLITGACVRTVDVVVRGGNALALRGESSARSDSADLLLPVSEEGPNSFLRVVTRSSSTALKHHHDSSPYDYHLAVFLPFSSTSSSSGGRFVFYGIQVDAARSQFGEIVAVGEKTCAPGTGGAELRDFDVILGGGREEDDPSTIWTVWDVRGETVVQRSGVGSALDEREGSDPSGGGADEMADEWETLLSPPLPAFTSTYFEDLLQSTTQSPAELFSSHLFYPSRFSPASLSSALDAYIATLISVLPYSSSSHPAALSASYGTLADKVAATVACHVQLESSAQTGELLQAEFDKKVRTEWLGFLARVEEAERDARWAVGVVKGHGGDSIVVVQRDGLIVPTKKSSVEIVSSLATIPSHDPIRSTFLSLLPGSLYLANPSLAPPQTRQATLHLASLGYALASSLPLPTILFVEADIVSLTSSALSCSVEDASLDLYANRVEPFLHESVISNVRNGIGGAGEPFESAVKTVLDWTISPNDPLLSPSSNSSTEIPSPTAIAFLSSSLRTTIDLRFALARNVLLVLLFALSELAEDELESSSLAPLISSALSVVQCLGNLKWLAGVTGAESAARLRAGATQDENALLNRFDSLKMSSEVSLSSPYPPSATTLPPSLLESILFSSAARLSQVTRNPPSTSIPSATTAFLSSTSLSSLRTLVQALPPDVELAEKLLLVGHVQAAYAFCARFPLEEGLAFVKGKAAMVLGKVEESEELFERVAAAFTPSPPSSIPTLLAALPKQLHSGSLLDYYRHVSAFYDRLSLDTSIVKFANLAIEAAASLSASSEKSGSDTKDLWSKLFKSTVALGNYEDAYMILTTNPYRETNSDAISHLITVMCHANEVDKLTQFTFVGLQDVVERTLAFKARHSDPMAFPNYLLVLYSWHICRGDYRKAASAMYLQAQRFGEVNGLFTDIGPRQAKSYLLAINALSLVDKKHAWLAAPVSSKRHRSDQPRKRQKLTSHIPEDKFSSSARSKEVEIIELEDVRREYNLVLSTLILANKFPESFQTAGVLSAENAVALFVQAGMFDTAILTARQLQVDMTGIFERLATKCIDAAAYSRSFGLNDDLHDLSWLLSSPLVSSLDGPIPARAEQYLQIMLDRHDSERTFWKYREAVLEKFLSLDRNLPLPSWLVDHFAAKNPELLVEAYLKYDLIEDATKQALNILRKAPATDVLPPSKSAATYLPWNLFDLVIRVVDGKAGENGEEQSASRSGKEASILVGKLRKEVESRLSGLERVR